ncbi:calcineurin-like phosphoesterase domain-containing protein [Rhizobium phaseoli]|uniref:metallophosphoesterase family protein n=1 Tax=Rhizobium phaseoli TaxID=396 RepID=UPI0007EB9820|nr:metallophosphoesterase family protein [Rhizobium phaseoli]ANM04995.1 calcineurin-like phosphoesterase domain-containing protein [Rhizobium phaseoli]
MTRILACSDIHNNVNAVRQLRAREGNDYDALIVAGDMGSDAADEIFDILRTFDCPILYVFGNWDSRLRHDQNFGDRCHHLHLSPYPVGDLAIVGETIDGIDPEWEASIEVKTGDPASVAIARQEHVDRQRAKLSKIVAGQSPERTVVVSHYRLTKTQTFLPGAPLFLFGHIHRFEDIKYRGQRFVNVSAMDKKVMVTRKGLRRAGLGDHRFLNDGSYVVISHDARAGFAIEPRRFDPDFSDWERVEGIFISSAMEVE